MTATTEKMIELTLDGRDVSVPEGGTILDAARKLGIEIPTLCHNEALKPYGSCWVCAVKVEGARTLVPSCSTRAAPGMKVTTLDDEIRSTRKLCLELLLSDHTGDCLGPCQMRCPAGIDVQGYIAHAARGEYDQALRLIKQKNPLPLICGRVCPRPCEDSCRRNLVDEPVAVDAIKRFVADADRAKRKDHYIPPVAEPTGKRVAVVGGGPAGLTCAYFLAQRGHKVTIFEAQPRLGGMLVWGIPAYRLPRDVLDAEIDTILELGVEARCGARMGRDFTLDSLKKDGFDAVFLGIGATDSRRMRVDGEDKDGVMSGTDFLRDFGLGKSFDFSGKRVAVIGGGNTAIDAARTSLRLGASEVTVIYRRSRAEMPAQDVEVEDAEAEGVQFHFLASPTKILGDGKVAGIEYVRMELGEPDESGRRRPQPVEGSETTLPLEICIAAIGQIPDLSPTKDEQLEETSWGALAANEYSLATSRDGVFAGGDCVNGAATVVEAVAHGRQGAVSVDAWLNGRPVERSEKIFNLSRGDWQELDPADFEHFLKTPRQHMSCLDMAERISGFAEVEQGLTGEQVRSEAARCLECGCSSAFECRVRQYAQAYDAVPQRLAGDHREELPDDRHPLVRMEMQKCIMCGACVRTCEEVHGVSAIGFTGRGFQARVRPAFGDSLLAAGCISCGGCVDACPTGAFTERLGKEGGPFALQYKETVCSGCGVGCVMEAGSAPGGALITVRPFPSETPPPPNGTAFCIRGRFAHRALAPEDRIAEPMIRRNGQLEAAALAEALGEAGRLLRKGGKQTCLLASAHAPAGELSCIKGLGASCGSEAVGSLSLSRERAALAGLEAALGRRTSPRAAQAALASDCILIVACDPLATHHVAGVNILSARQLGAELCVLATEPNGLDRHATLRIRPRTDSVPAVLAGLVARCAKSGEASCAPARFREETARAFAPATPEAVEGASDVAAAELEDLHARLSRARNPLVVIDTARAGTRLAAYAALLGVLLPQAVEQALLLALRPAADSHALSRLGFQPLAPATLAGKTVFALREDPLGVGAQPKTLVVADAIWSESARQADVVLPVPSLLEASGTLYATGGVRRELCGCERPLLSHGSEAVLGGLSGALGGEAECAPPSFAPEECVPRLPAIDDPLAPEPLVPASESADAFMRRFLAWAREAGLR